MAFTTLLLFAAAGAGLTSLSLDEYTTIGADDELPPNLLVLDSCEAAASASLLPLTRLQQLTLREIEFEVMPAAELRQLSVLTCLTSVDFCYGCTAQQIDAAADGWCVLPMEYLHLVPSDCRSLQRDTLLQLSKLTRLSSLTLSDCVSNDSVPPEMLGDVLAQLTRLQTLRLTTYKQQQEPQQLGATAAAGAAQDDAAAANAAGAVAAAVAATAPDAAAGSFLTRMLHRLAGSLSRMQLSTLYLEGQSIGRAEAAALAKLQGLWQLGLSGCDLEDCSVAAIVFALHRTLEVLDLSDNPRVTDASLPVLVRLMPGITQHQLRGTGITAEGLQRYLPAT
jgi:hypothetical protein